MSTLTRALLLDTAIVQELAGAIADSGNEFMLELMETYTRDAHAALERMRQQVCAGDAASLAREAHRLKGSSATVGAIRLAAACFAIELSAKSGICDGLGARVDAALEILDATRVALAQFFRGTIAEAA